MKMHNVKQLLNCAWYQAGSPSLRRQFTQLGSQQLVPGPKKVTRLLKVKACIGTASYVSDTLLVTARHCVIDRNGQFASVHLGNDKPLAFVAASPIDDLALLEVTGESS